MNENQIINRLMQCFEAIIPSQDRRASIEHLSFVVNLVFFSFGDSKTFSLESIRRSMIDCLHKNISRSAFWERLSGKRLTRILRGLIEELMTQFSDTLKVNNGLLEKLGVTAIEVVDSSSITLSEKARDAFPGTRTKSSIKWHASFNLLNDGTLSWFQLTPGRQSDQTCFPNVKSSENKLFIFDLGYWSYELLYSIEKNRKFFSFSRKIQCRYENYRCGSWCGRKSH